MSAIKEHRYSRMQNKVREHLEQQTGTTWQQRGTMDEVVEQQHE
jgi:hypothetical protein